MTAHTCRAYGGPAHGQMRAIPVGSAPPAAMDFGTGDVVYRLIGRPGSGEPALDHLGNYLYMPVLPGAASLAEAHHRPDSSIEAVVEVAATVPSASGAEKVSEVVR